MDIIAENLKCENGSITARFTIPLKKNVSVKAIEITNDSTAYVTIRGRDRNGAMLDMVARTNLLTFTQTRKKTNLFDSFKFDVEVDVAIDELEIECCQRFQRNPEFGLQKVVIIAADADKNNNNIAIATAATEKTNPRKRKAVGETDTVIEKRLRSDLSPSLSPLSQQQQTQTRNVPVQMHQQQHQHHESRHIG